MGKKRMDYKSLAQSNPGKITAQAKNVNSVAKDGSLDFETADNLLMKKTALNDDSLAYASKIRSRLG
ncbi:MAG: hypothetical protein ACOX47_02890 [Bacillota bacterium]